MWIIPSNHPLHSAFAQECVDSKEELKILLDHFGTETVMKDGQEKVYSKLPLIWRSTRSLYTTWFARWKKVWWIQRLFGSTLRLSRTNDFTEKYISSLEDIPASHFHPQAGNSESSTRDIFGQPSNGGSEQLDLFSATSKTSSIISTSDIEMSDKAYADLVIRLKKEYFQRKRWVLLISVKDYSSSPWPTPTAMNRVRDEDTLQKCLEFRKRNANQNTVPLYLAETVLNWATPTINGNNNVAGMTEKSGDGLMTQVKNWGTPRQSMKNFDQKDRPDQSRIEDQVKMWKTPRSSEMEGGLMEIREDKDGHYKLRDQAHHWTTPNTRDWKDTIGMHASRRDGKSRFDQLPRQVFGLLDKDLTNTNGNLPALNPAWVLRLMGSTLRKTFFAWRGMPSLNNNPSSPSEPSSENLESYDLEL